MHTVASKLRAASTIHGCSGNVLLTRSRSRCSGGGPGLPIRKVPDGRERKLAQHEIVRAPIFSVPSRIDPGRVVTDSACFGTVLLRFRYNKWAGHKISRAGGNMRAEQMGLRRRLRNFAVCILVLLSAVLVYPSAALPQTNFVTSDPSPFFGVVSNGRFENVYLYPSSFPGETWD
jgi:hypothetical protein